MPDNRVKFTDRWVRSVPLSDARQTYLDAELRGLILIVTRTAKLFYYRRKVGGVSQRHPLGQFPSRSVEEARAAARAMAVKIDVGDDPISARRALHAEPTFEELFSLFLEKKRNRAGKPLSPATTRVHRQVVESHLKPLCKLKVSALTPDKIKAVVTAIKAPGPHNRAKTIISATLEWAAAEGLVGAVDRPTRMVRDRLIKSRERFLQPQEVGPLMDAIEASPLRDFFMMALFTGARRSNLQAMRWRDLNLEESTWTIPETKNGDRLQVPLVPEAVEILTRRKAERVANETWVFPGTGWTGHLVEPKTAWRTVLKRAGIQDFRIHDIRRTLGSWQARAGASLPIIGKSLGHRSPQATVVYSRLDLTPVRASVENAVSDLLAARKRRAE